jgi:ribonucleoside-diphosphate reductase alpha chain
MAGASGKKLDETYKLAWVRGLKTTYYLRTMAATHAEKSTVHAGAMNAVAGASGGTGTMAADAALPAIDEVRFCSIDDPDCEACQ